MKFSKVVNGVATTPPMPVARVLFETKTTITRGTSQADVIALFDTLGYKLVPPTTFPTIPSELMGRCIIKLGIPIVTEAGTLVRTYTFEEATSTQLVSAGLSVRAKRDRTLADKVDSINAVRWAAMTEEQRAAWTTYRQALLDLPTQAGFPMNVTWPVAPAN